MPGHQDDDRRSIWNKRYAAKSEPGQPAFVLTEYQSLLPKQGRALDIASGTGADSLFMARHGLTVEAWDFSEVALDALTRAAGSLPVTTRCISIDSSSFTESSYQVIVNCHYLDRSIIPAMISALAPGGVLFFQTFTADKRAGIGPSNPDFLLAPGELRELVAGLEILAYRDEGRNADESHGLAGRACIVARAQ